MEIYNEEKTQILTEYDEKLGYIIPSIIEYIIPANEETPEKKAIKSILIYKKYTDEEIIMMKISKLKQELNKCKEDVEQVELFEMERNDYESKKKRCVEIIIELRQLEKELGEKK